MDAQTKRTKADQDLNLIGKRWVANGPDFYPIEKEKALGEKLALEVERTSVVVCDPAVSSYLNSLANKIAQNSDSRIPIDVRVIKTSVAGALTLAGGILYVDTGLLLRLHSEAELAGILSHGIAHTALRSITRERTMDQIMELSAVEFVMLPPTMSGYGIYEAAQFAIPMPYLKFERDSEFDADYFGLQYLYESAYDLEPYIQLVARGDFPAQLTTAAATSKTRKAAAHTPDAFSPFPSVKAREKAMRDEIAKILPPRDDVTVSTPEFEQMQQRLHDLTATQPRPDKPVLRQCTKQLPCQQ